jgi:Helix-turn-helix
MLDIISLVDRLTQLPQAPMSVEDDTIVHGLWALSPKSAAELMCNTAHWEDLLATFQNPAVVWSTRRELRLTQAQLAREAGISQQLLAFIESGKRKMRPEVLQRLWRALWTLSQQKPAAVELLCRLNEELNALIVSEKVPL